MGAISVVFPELIIGMDTLHYITFYCIDFSCLVFFVFFETPSHEEDEEDLLESGQFDSCDF